MNTENERIVKEIEARKEKVIKILEWLQRQYSKNDTRFIFRGTNEEYSKKDNDGVNSSLYRELKHHYKKEYFQYDPLCIIKHEEAMLDRVRRRKLYDSGADNITILTDIQHFKGYTNCIDFTNNIFIALFFACDGTKDMDKNGEILCLPVNPTIEISDVNYDKKRKLEDISIIRPSKSSSSHKRVLSQRSIFVYPKKGYIDKQVIQEKKYNDEIRVEEGIVVHKIVIKKHDKRLIMQQLKLLYGIEHRTMYDDIIGFIQEDNEYRFQGRIASDILKNEYKKEDESHTDTNNN